MTERELIVIAGLVIFGLIAGIFVSQTSKKREAIHGGMMADIFNYISSSIFAASTPTVLVCVLVLDTGIIVAIAMGLTLFLSSLAVLMLYAVFERPAILKAQKAEDTGWTEQDARTSGL